eukprot:CAMPEP_0172192738 /NCGR_PEP_ID=MMETSP1050-20130122/24519_1 /TAXON_ID=233186 /ORGANISM="Cryptomonas curvata, Strain CCAP979/52" /LENGTH=124 /DNA_ID=CAMNT_0012868123 /DNA_START=133 /DNA_END=507 /DNA_ORIENTATION=+
MTFVSETVEWLKRGIESGEQLVFTKERLKVFNGRLDGLPLILCVVGHCFDVTEGEQFYGVGQTYNAFVGRDGSTGFVSGVFTEEGALEDVSSLSGAQLMGVEHWLKFYKTCCTMIYIFIMIYNQ